MHRGVLLQPGGQDEGEARAVTPSRGKRIAYSRSGQELVCPNQRTSQTATPSPLVSLPQRLIHRLNVPESGKKSNRGATHGCSLVANGIDNVHRAIDLLSASLLTRFLGRADFSSPNARVIRTSD